MNWKVKKLKHKHPFKSEGCSEFVERILIVEFSHGDLIEFERILLTGYNEISSEWAKPLIEKVRELISKEEMTCHY